MVATSAATLNGLLRICETFAINHCIEYNVNKLVCLTVIPQSLRSLPRPNIYLAGLILKYMEIFKYLGHFVILRALGREGRVALSSDICSLP